MLNFENYIQVLRTSYDAGYVRKAFYSALELIGGIPEEEQRFVFCSVKVAGKDADWIKTNNALNAFEFKLNRKLWKRKSRKQKMLMVKAIEPNSGNLTYHFHTLIKIEDLKVMLADDELKYIIKNIIMELDETNSRNPNLVQVDVFRFKEENLNTPHDDFGKCLHYCVKTSSRHYNPLSNIILTKKQQEQKQLL